MRFWDSSALVPLVVEEPSSPACRRLYRSDPGVMVWVLTRVEMISAVQRRNREGELRGPAADSCRRVDRLAARWQEMVELGPARDRAERLLAAHPLRAADAMQLAAALVLWDERPKGRPFVTLDSALATAARAEGFEVIVPAA
ncbi:MAG: PIN domain-containing protein [Myxococcales bacterium]|nr:PIN domain-containing protein [Myxococcales bacterium]